MVQVPFKGRKQQVESILARPNATNRMGMINPRVVSREEAGIISEYKAMQNRPTLFQQRKALTGPQGLMNMAKGTGRGAAEAASIWHKEGVKPTTGAASFLFSPSVREEYRRARGEGQSMREALGTGWDEGLTDTPWGVKGAAELLLDPLNLVPFIGFPGAIARGAGAGARLGTRTLAAGGREIAEGVAQMPVPSALRPQRAYAMPPEGSPGSIGARRTEALGKQGTSPITSVEDATTGKGIMFHGSQNTFEAFDLGKANENALYGPGVYLTDNPNIASGYARTRSGSQSAPNVRSVTVQLRKVFDIDAPADKEILSDLQSTWNPDDLEYYVEERISPITFDLLEGKVSNPTNKQLYRAMVEITDDPYYPKVYVNDFLSSLGFDGITHIGGGIKGDIPHRVVIAIGDEFASLDKAITSAIGKTKADPREATSALGKQGTETEKVRFASTMSSGGTVEAGMRPGSIASVHTSELSPARVKAYNEAFGTNYTPKNIADNAALQSLKQSGAQHYHASPVCKNFTKAKTIRTADPNDLAIAKSVARDIREVKPPTISIENVPAYRDTALFKLITKELDNAGYNWDTQIVNAADYGGAQTRTRLILRAVRKDVGELPSLPRQTQDFSQTGRGLDWYATLKDLIDTERRIKGKEMPLKVAFISRTKGKLNDELARINRYIRLGHLTPDRPIITMGGSASKGVPSASNRGSVSPTLLATEKAVPRIIFPGTKGLDNATAIRVTPTMMRRLMGLPDSYVLPQDIYLAKNILGDGVHGAITKNFIQPLVDIIKGNR